MGYYQYVAKLPWEWNYFKPMGIPICGNLSGFSVKSYLSNIHCIMYLWSEPALALYNDGPDEVSFRRAPFA